MTKAIGICAALLLVAPAWAAAQDPVPKPPPTQETVTVRAVNGSFELKGTSSANSFTFTQQCEAKQGYTESTVQLVLPMEIQGTPNDPLERAMTLLRTAVAEGLEMSVESSSEEGQILLFEWARALQFRARITSLAVKYSLFFEDGTPARATANVAFKQQGRARAKGEDDNETLEPKKKTDCPH